MRNFIQNPAVFFLFSLSILWVSARIGASFRKTRPQPEDEEKDFTFILGATLTLLGLIIGFTFSMALDRYDQRKNYEEAEANAIGTEFVRADVLPIVQASKVRDLLKRYLEQRILYYKSLNQDQIRQINGQTSQLQTEMWSAVITPAKAEPTPLASLLLSGMNDVLNSQGYTQAAWWNRIPIAAWILLLSLSIFCNMLVGYAAHKKSRLLFLILPFAISISLFLIADIDSPRRGVIVVQPQNLESLAESLRSQ